MSCRLIHDCRVSLPPVTVDLLHDLGVGQALRLGREGLLAGAAAVERAAVRAVVARGVLLTLPSVRMADEGNACLEGASIVALVGIVVAVIPDGDACRRLNPEVLAVN